MKAQQLFQIGLKELHRKWVPKELVPPIVFFTAMGGLSGWWTAKHGVLIISAQVLWLALVTGVPLGVQRALSQENRFLQSLPLPWLLRVSYLSFSATIRGTQVVLPLGLGFALSSRLTQGLSARGIVVDLTVGIVGLLVGTGTATAIVDMVDPQSVYWPWRGALKNVISKLVESHPFGAVQLARMVRRPSWTALVFASGISSVLAAIPWPDRSIEALTLLSFIPTMWATTDANQDEVLPLVRILPKGTLRWIRSRVFLLAAVSLIPGISELILVALQPQTTEVALLQYALFWFTSAILGLSLGTAYGALSWQDGRSFGRNALSGIVGTAIWGFSTIVPALYTLPPGASNWPSLALALAASTVLLGLTGVALLMTAARLERRDFDGYPADSDES